MGEVTYIYTYNSNGDIDSSTVKGEDMEEGEYSYTLTYKILSRDSHGNWTRRQVNSSNGDKHVTKRVITYWE